MLSTKQRVSDLEKWMDRQDSINILKDRIDSLRKELEAIKDCLGITVETYKIFAMRTKEEKS